MVFTAHETMIESQVGTHHVDGARRRERGRESDRASEGARASTNTVLSPSFFLFSTLKCRHPNVRSWAVHFEARIVARFTGLRAW